MSVRREALGLVAAVLVVDAVCVAVYFLARLPSASAGTKLIFTAAWTVVTLVVVVRGLTRIRTARLNRLHSAQR